MRPSFQARNATNRRCTAFTLLIHIYTMLQTIQKLRLALWFFVGLAVVHQVRVLFRGANKAAPNTRTAVDPSMSVDANGFHPLAGSGLMGGLDARLLLPGLTPAFLRQYYTEGTIESSSNGASSSLLDGMDINRAAEELHIDIALRESRPRCAEAAAPFLPVDKVVDAPRDVPPSLLTRYTLNGRMQMIQEYYNDVAWGTQADNVRVYAKEDIEGMISRIQKGEVSEYGETDNYLYALLQRNRETVADKRALVMGSVVPWYEATAFAYGADYVLGVEYGPRMTTYPRLTYIRPSQVANCTLDYDVAFSISSFEHDGLGRYGDPLVPEADLVAMQVMKRLVKPGGYMYYASPMGSDTLVMNAHRVYGRHRWLLLFAGWEIVDYEGVNDGIFDANAQSHHQPVWLLRNPVHV